MSFPYYICVPHQRAAYIDWSPELVADLPEEDRDPNDGLIVGDHDLHCVHVIMDASDARALLVCTDPVRGGQARHQAIKIAGLAAEILREEDLLEAGLLEDEEAD